jgi:hypothetical protein
MTKEVAPVCWSRRRIARELGIDRETVGRYLRLAKPAISIAGFEELGEPFRPPTFRLATCLSRAAMPLAGDCRRVRVDVR